MLLKDLLDELGDLKEGDFSFKQMRRRPLHSRHSRHKEHRRPQLQGFFGQLETLKSIQIRFVKIQITHFKKIERWRSLGIRSG